MAFSIRHNLACIGAAILLAACGPDDALQVEIAELVEADHWAGDMKTCTPRYKILNNTTHGIERLNMSLVWRDAYGEVVEMPMLMNTLLPADTATRTGTGTALYGACADVELTGLRDILRCDAVDLSQQECIAKLQIIYRDGLSVNGPASIE